MRLCLSAADKKGYREKQREIGQRTIRRRENGTFKFKIINNKSSHKK